MWMWMLACAEAPVDPPAPAPSWTCAGVEGARVGECPGPFTLPTADGPYVGEARAGQVLVVHLTNGSDLDADASLIVQAELDARDGVEALDVLTDVPSTEADALAWQQALGLTYPVAFDEAGTFGSDWGRTTLYPTLLVLDPTGEVRARFHERVEGRLPDALDALR